MMLLLAAHALYVGNQACEPCHVEIARAYATTPMARSSGTVKSLTAGNFRHAESKTEYRIQSSGLVTASRGDLNMQRQLDYFIGSGAAGQSYLYSRDHFLFQAPVTWYSQQSRWDVSPGYEKDDVSRWSRAIEPDCLSCHSSQVRYSPAYQNRYAEPPFAQDGVGCERCHGPGSEHVQGRGTLINPAKLEPAKRDSVCAQCHMSGEVRIDRAGQNWMSYRPGSLLSNFSAYFVLEGASELKATSYVEKLEASKCKLASGDRLWCGTCHDPHRVPAPAQRVAWYRAKCLSCHQLDSCGRQGDCTSCHMPKGKVADVDHGVLTDHAIPKIPTAPAPVRNLWRLAPFRALDKGDRELGLAYAALSFRTGDLRQEIEAIRLLSAAPSDMGVRSALANLYENRGDFSQALKVYRPGHNDPGFAPALVNLGVYLGLTGRMAEAISVWRGVLTQNPCLAQAGVNLKKALKATGDREALDSVSKIQEGCVF